MYISLVRGGSTGNTYKCTYFEKKRLFEINPFNIVCPEEAFCPELIKINIKSLEEFAYQSKTWVFQGSLLLCVKV